MRIVFSLVIGAALLAGTASAAVPETARVGAVHGQVVLQTGTSASTVAAATDLKAGDVLQLATDAKLTVAFADGGSVLVAGPAVLDVADLTASGRRLVLRSGAIPRAYAGRVALEVQSPDGASMVLQNATGSANVTSGATSFAKLGGAYAKVWQDGSAQDLSGTWSSGVHAAMAAADSANAGGKSYGVGDTLRVASGASESVAFSDGTSLMVVGPAELGFVQMDSAGRRVMLRSGTISNAAVAGLAMEIQTPAGASLVLQEARGMARVSGGNVTFQKLGGDYAQVWANDRFTALNGTWSNSAAAAPTVRAPAPAVTTQPARVVTASASAGGSRADRIAELEAEVARLRAELSNARAAGYTGRPAKYLELGEHVIAYRPGDDFIVENTAGGGAKLTYDGSDFGIVTVGRDTNLFLWLGDYVEFDSNGQIIAFTGISHLYDSLSTFFMWDNPIENSSDVSISRPELR